MPIQIQGNGGTVAEVDGTTFRALRTTARPVDSGTLGHYKASVITGSMAAGLAGGSDILQFRWTDATRLAVIQKVHLDGMIATTAFAAGQILFKLFASRAFSAAGTGGNTLTLTGNNQKMRTSMGSSLLGELRSASTSALGAGTKTNDGAPIGQVNSHSSGGTGAATPIIGSIFLPNDGELFAPQQGDGEHPLVLAASEGFSIQATVPGTGVWILGVTIRWAEVSAF